jgi:hypothetical protein
MATTSTNTDREIPGEQRPNKQANKGGALSDVQPDPKNVAPANEAEHEGATEAQVGDRGGPGVGFDQEPEREKDEGGVS